MKHFRCFLCFLLIIQPVFFGYGCDSDSSSSNNESNIEEPPSQSPDPEEVPSDTYNSNSQTSAKADTNENGKAVIKSEPLSTKYDITVKDENGNAVPGLEVDYIEFEGIPYIVISDPQGDYVPAIIFSEPSSMANVQALNNSYGGSVSAHFKTIDPSLANTNSEVIESQAFFTTVALVVGIVSLTAAQLSFINNAYQVQTFYVSDLALAHDDWIIYCKTFEEVADLEYHRLMGIVDLAGMVITFATAGTGGYGSNLSFAVKKEVVTQGVNKIRNHLIELAVHAYGKSRDYFLDNEVAVMVFPIPEGRIRNMWAPYTVFIDHPICMEQEGALSGTLIDATTGDYIDGSVAASSSGRYNETDTINGNYSFDSLPSDYYTVEASSSGYESVTKNIDIVEGEEATLNFALSPSITTGGEYRIVLEWNENPRDLDSHLYTPSSHVYFGNTGSLNSSPYCALDLDDTNGHGPETITITSEAMEGSYSYKIHKYAGDGTIFSSDAEVRLFGESGLINSWRAPSNPSLWWHVFDINPDTGQITTINAYE